MAGPSLTRWIRWWGDKSDRAYEPSAFGEAKYRVDIINELWKEAKQNGEPCSKGQNRYAAAVSMAIGGWQCMKHGGG